MKLLLIIFLIVVFLATLYIQSKQIYTPFKIYNGTPEGVPLEIQGQPLPINELNGTPPKGTCHISNLHRFKEGFQEDRPPLTQKIDAIYYINLKKREDRKQQFLDNFSYIDESKINRVNAHYYPDNGAVGCLMSHITALNKALQDNKGENILICEDDLHIKDMGYCNKMLELLFQNIQDWDVVMLGQNTIESVDTGLFIDSSKITRIINSQTASGYLIKHKYIPRLLKIYENDMINYLRTGEWGNYYVDQSWKVLQPKDKWYSFTPSVAVQRPSFSDIQKGFINVEV